MRLTEYHCGKAVLKNKELDSEAAAKLAAYEDLEDLGYSFEEVKEVIEAFKKAVRYGGIDEFMRAIAK